MDEQEQQELNKVIQSKLSITLPKNMVDEENEKIWYIIEALEEDGWHPSIQERVKVYIECGIEGVDIVKTSQGQQVDRKSAFGFLHDELSRLLFQYQNRVNNIIKNYEYDVSIRKKLIIFLNPKCVYCGNEDIDLLDIDHKNALGYLDRRWAKQNNLSLYTYYWNNLINAFMRLQILCIKCHKRKTRGALSQIEIDDKIKNEVKVKHD